MSEGDRDQDPTPYIPASPALDAHVRWLHKLAREGSIDAQTAERHLNAHLAAACWQAGAPASLARLVMPLTDAPQFGNLPDLWAFVSRALTGPDFKIEQGLQGLILQTLPCFRRPSPAPQAAPNGPDLFSGGVAPVLVNLMLGLLLGLYPDATGKPQFAVRARVFRSLHAALTEEQEAQERFVRARPALASLALMEYLARVLPACMPAEEEFLRHTFGMAQFFEQAPLVCNEFRSGLTALDAEPAWRPLSAGEWAGLDARADEAVERTARVKRKTVRPCDPHRHQEDPCLDWGAALGCPIVPRGSPDDYKILAHAFRLPGRGADAERFHTLMQVGVLPANLRRMQADALAEQVRVFFSCVYRARPEDLTRPGSADVGLALHVDALAAARLPRVPVSQGRVGAAARVPGGHAQRPAHVLGVQVPGGRLRRHDGESRPCHPMPRAGLTPGVRRGRRSPSRAAASCSAPAAARSIRIASRARSPGPWPAASRPPLEGRTGTPCSSARSATSETPPAPRPARPPPADAPAPRRKHQPPLVERVNHLTGRMEQFGFCARHTPPKPFLERCASAKDLLEWGQHARGAPPRGRDRERGRP